MALTFLKRSELPPAVKGKVGTAQVTITEAGQIQLSTLATKQFGGPQNVVVAFDGPKMYFLKLTSKLAAKADPKDQVELKSPKKGDHTYFSGGSTLKAATRYGCSVTYDYAGSGNQNFPITIDDKNHCLWFELPESGK